jgi:hypothetical protein
MQFLDIHAWDRLLLRVMGDAPGGGVHDGSRDLGRGGTPLQHAGTEHVLQKQKQKRYSRPHDHGDKGQSAGVLFSYGGGHPKSLISIYWGEAYRFWRVDVAVHSLGLIAHHLQALIAKMRGTVLRDTTHG